MLGALAAELGCGEAVRSAEDSFAVMGVDAFAGITYADIGERGTVINEIVHMTGESDCGAGLWNSSGYSDGR